MHPHMYHQVPKLAIALQFLPHHQHGADQCQLESTHDNLFLHSNCPVQDENKMLKRRSNTFFLSKGFKNFDLSGKSIFKFSLSAQDNALQISRKIQDLFQEIQKQPIAGLRDQVCVAFLLFSFPKAMCETLQDLWQSLQKILQLFSL